MPSEPTPAWKIWVDMGGTFTDCLAQDPAGATRRAKVLSSGALRGRVLRARSVAELELEPGWPQPGFPVTGFSLRLLGRATAAVSVARHDPATGLLRLGRPLDPAPAPGAAFEVRCDEDAVLLALRQVTGTAATAELPPMALRLATTLGTNALLQRKGAPTALFVTAGLGDLLRIGTQQRPELFALAVRRPEPLHHAVVEVPERVAADGAVLRPLDIEALRQRAVELVRGGVRCAAVALANSYRDPEHEQRLAEMLREVGFDHVSASAALSPLITLRTRAETALVDAYLAPAMGAFLGRVQRAVRQTAPVLVMNSAGGMACADTFEARDSLLSGPAGGVVGAAEAGRRSGFARVISFDMGGTSTDVARCDLEAGVGHDLRFEQRVGDAHLSQPALAIHTVAAGGGSICAWDNGALRVGPHSAGADPGPACYGAGGPLTLTDTNLLLGRLRPRRFRIPVNPEHADRALQRLQQDLQHDTGEVVPDEQLLQGLLELANERMADAIRKVSVRRGYDPAQHALLAFGGAGPQHACAVASRLGMDTVVVPADAGLLSAAGVGHAAVERIRARQVLLPLDQALPALDRQLDQLAHDAVRDVVADGVPADRVLVRSRLVSLRFVGQDSSLQVERVDGQPLDQAFARQHLALYGHLPEDRPVEVESIRVVAAGEAPMSAPEPGPPPAVTPSTPARVRAYLGGRWQQVPCYERAALPAGAQLQTPALVLDQHCTTVVEPGWEAEVDQAGALVLRRRGQEDDGAALQQRPEAVRLELFVGRLTAVAEQMGEVLRRTALSTNIKERLDFSCAVLDGAGRLVVNAPHIPVHLGSLGLCVRAVRQALDLGPGDVAVTNHPAYGGSHLPDVTVICPVFIAGARQPLAYVAARAHHAEIGGSCPGSMPPDATCLAQEGVVIPPTLLQVAGRPRWRTLRALLGGGPYPSRALEDNVADVRAALAAVSRGAADLAALAEVHGAQTLQRQMDALRQRAGDQVSRALAALPDGEHRASGILDDGTPLAVCVTISGDRAQVDFAGTGAVHPGNLNATPAIVRSVVIYVLRLLVQRDLPLNEGLMQAVELKLPSGLLDPPFGDDPAAAPAVVGGNVETSQRLVDLLLRALGLAACSQGTMNNVLFGDSSSGYYETVGGGGGAGPGFCGASAVHSHMTNTRITDVEQLEQRYPVRVERFAVRRGSGGAGLHRGGDGVVRELTFLAPMSLSLLTQRRSQGPCGLAGGSPGQPGAQRVIRADGVVQPLGAIDGCEVGPGDRLVLETPGGGGWGDLERGVRRAECGVKKPVANVGTDGEG